MTMKLLIMISILCSSLHAQKLDETTKKAFAETYRKEFDLSKEFPNNLNIHVIFVDLNNDGKSDALVTSKAFNYEDGWDWHVYLRNNAGDWDQVKESQEAKKEGVFALLGDFYRYTAKNAPAHVMIMRLVWEKDTFGTDEPEQKVYSAVRIGFDAKGAITLKKMVVPSKKELKNYEQLKHETIGK
jgi:hypothetical protein